VKTCGSFAWSWLPLSQKLEPPKIPVQFSVEISAIACRAFFAELGVQPVRTAYGPFVKWQGRDVTLLEGDFFDLDGIYDAAVDRGALVAFSPPDRVRYSNHLRARLAPDAPILLVTIEFDPAREGGPPYPVFPDEVHQIFSGSTELARSPMRRPRWDRIGGADAVVWAAHVAGTGRGTCARSARQ
jgi:thiopurine S-methyltransferase